MIIFITKWQLFIICSYNIHSYINIERKKRLLREKIYSIFYTKKQYNILVLINIIGNVYVYFYVVIL